MRRFRLLGEQLRRFFENIEKRLRAIDAVTFSAANLLHNCKSLQPLNGPLRRGEGDAELFNRAFGGDERIGREQFDDAKRRLRGFARDAFLPLGKRRDRKASCRERVLASV